MVGSVGISYTHGHDTSLQCFNVCNGFNSLTADCIYKAAGRFH